jgi:RNA polymerase sigma-70 factor (ECF subfamily)
VGELLAHVFCREHARVLSSVLARVGDFPIAEESVQDAFAAAVVDWGDAPPPNPRAWLLRVAANKAVDRLRRRSRFPEVDPEALAEAEARSVPGCDEEIPDDRLRLVFTCCHPALAPESQVELTLRTVAGLTTEEIARLFFTTPSAMAQRLVRTQRKIRDALIPYAVPDADMLPERLAAVLAVIYLVFTEGYSASTGDAIVRTDLCDEAIRLARLLAELLPEEPEVLALLSLVLLHDARRAARASEGDLVLLGDQDRSLWDRAQLAQALVLLDAALHRGAHGPYALQAAIAGLHARAVGPGDTDWPQISALYDLLLALEPTPTVELNRAIAHAMSLGPEAGLRALAPLRFKLDDNHLFHAARAELLAQLGRLTEAASAYRLALRHVRHPAERRFLAGRLAQCRR